MSADVPTGKRKIVGLGELLWDSLPNGKQLGGAPANFAYMTNLLGDEGIVASRVGKDELGTAAVRRLCRAKSWRRGHSERFRETMQPDP